MQEYEFHAAFQVNAERIHENNFPFLLWWLDPGFVVTRRCSTFKDRSVSAHWDITISWQQMKLSLQGLPGNAEGARNIRFLNWKSVPSRIITLKVWIESLKDLHLDWDCNEQVTAVSLSHPVEVLSVQLFAEFATCFLNLAKQNYTDGVWNLNCVHLSCG